MIEIVLDEREWKGKSERLKKVIERLLEYGWEKFGNNGITVLFKDTPLSQAKNELKLLEIDEIEPEEWKEDLYNEYTN